MRCAFQNYKITPLYDKIHKTDVLLLTIVIAFMLKHHSYDVIYWPFQYLYETIFSLKCYFVLFVIKQVHTDTKPQPEQIHTQSLKVNSLQCLIPTRHFFMIIQHFFLFLVAITYVNVDYKDSMHALWLGNAITLLQRTKTFYYNLTIKVSINSQFDKENFSLHRNPI